ncbi:killer cell lectin-like receptor subfamily B member 1B allele C [Microtus ochrogaster]|uniref:Killer cell lectin-like receptor subfamily B member 1B allele C n=1 Tax=Microtus ochrogaster TaxID=79684 RepID=A0ABM1AZ18_MICOH|nr:killer cell lectin-like receptor subfamily B member 1B allele C [Microtus ochrogaster]
MDASVVYDNLNQANTQESKQASPPAPPPDCCWYPRRHRLALILGCFWLILLVLIVIRLGVLVQKSPIGKVIQENKTKTTVGKCNVNVSESSTKATESSVQLTCSNDWRPHREKCIQFSQENGVWKEGLSNCTRKGATLLLIQDQEELIFVKGLIKERGHLFWIGLNYSLPNKTWRWINGSTLSSDVLNITGDAKLNSCVAISKDKVVSESCASDNMWICQNEPKRL